MRRTIVECNRCKREAKDGKTWAVGVVVEEAHDPGTVLDEKDTEVVYKEEELCADCLGILRAWVKDFARRYKPRKHRRKADPTKPAAEGAAGSEPPGAGVRP